MTIHLLSGFLGSGKTTAIRQACRSLLQQGERVGVITNDQGIKLVDGYFFENLGIPEKQVGNGCFCCNYSDLDNRIGELMEEFDPQVIFAESVGSCTDIVATVFKPLKQFRKVKNITLTTVVDARLLDMLIKNELDFEEEVRYIFFKQLEEAGIILLNKTDLVDKETLQNTVNNLNVRYPDKEIIQQNSIDENGGTEWLNRISSDTPSGSLRTIEVDYDTYATGEAKMGYLDQQLQIESDDGNAVQSTIQLIGRFMEQVRVSGATIGHVKFWMNDRFKISYTSTTNEDPLLLIPAGNENKCSLIVNARVQMEPENLYGMMADAIASLPAKVTVVNSSWFKPGYPKPLHRIAD